MKKIKSNKMENFVEKVKTSFNNQKQYKIFGSKQFIGLVLLIIFSYLMIVSIVQVPGFSTINSYTFGMLFGYYSYFIYIGFIWYGLCLLFNLDIKIEKYIAKKFKWRPNLSWTIYLTFVIGIAMITESIIQIVESKDVFPGISSFRNFFVSWWNDFANVGKSGNAALPGINNLGIVDCLFMSLISSWAGFPVSIIFGIILVAYFVFYIFYGSLIKIIKTKISTSANQKQKVKQNEFKEYETKILDLSFEDNNSFAQNEENKDLKMKTVTISIDNPQEMFPIENPFDENNSEINEDFIIDKTKEFNLKNSKTKEIDFDKPPINVNIVDEQDKSIEFELDIFNTGTSELDPNKFNKE